MRLLLDTHTLLWFALGDPKLSLTAHALITAPENAVAVSPASWWEIAIKMSVNKYTLPVPHEVFFETAIAAYRFTVLGIEPRHTAALIGLPFHHRDPFDRLLVAQAIAEQIPIVSADPVLDAYPVSRLW